LLPYISIGLPNRDGARNGYGRIDLVAHHPKCILVMELKMNRNGGLKAARNQMSARRYSSAYSAEGKPIYEVSIDFDEKSRSLMDFDIEPYRLG
jgi:Holliday junction resolvase